jgi:DNA-binding winged helix-turn-helix (wHTH) protein
MSNWNNAADGIVSTGVAPPNEITVLFNDSTVTFRMPAEATLADLVGRLTEEGVPQRRQMLSVTIKLGGAKHFRSAVHSYSKDGMMRVENVADPVCASHSKSEPAADAEHFPNVEKWEVSKELLLGMPDATECLVVAAEAPAQIMELTPPSLADLLIRTQSLLHHPRDWRNTVLRVGSLSLDLLERLAFRNARTIDLLPHEFKLLAYMMQRPDRVMSREELLRRVWNYRFLPQTNLVDVHIGKLRRKVDAVGEPSMLRTVRCSGFILLSDLRKVTNPWLPPVKEGDGIHSRGPSAG